MEILKDLQAYDTRLLSLESLTGIDITNDSFTANTISGTIILEGSLPGSKLENGTITGDKIVTNSIYGIKNANIASDAAIDASKINFGALNHSTLLGIGTLTHDQLESLIAGLTISVTTNANNIGINGTAISSINTFLGNRTLNTAATDVTAAINELDGKVDTIYTPVTDLETINATYLTATSSPKVPTSAFWLEMTGNKVTLTEGEWELHGSIDFSNNGGNPGYTCLNGRWSSGNGTGLPNPLVTFSGSKLASFGDMPNQGFMNTDTGSWATYLFNLPTWRVEVAASAAIDTYAVPYALGSALASGLVTSYIYARRVN
jgi:hypothetical protein